MKNSRSKIFSGFIIFFCLITFVSCKNEEKKAADTNVITTIDTADVAGKKIVGTPNAVNSISFTAYKLTRQEMMDLEKNPTKAKKIILKIHLNNLSTPTIMRLFGYPAKDAKQGGYDEPGTEITPDGAITFNTPTDLRIGNNELVFKDFKPTGQWAEFNYILLTPTKKINPTGSFDLVFKISYYDSNKNSLAMVTLPQDSNPSPPAKPAD